MPKISLDCQRQGSVNVGLEVSMPDLVELRLAVLPTLSKAALGDLWKQFFGSTPPTQLRRNLMIPIRAYRIQEQTFGSLSARGQQRLLDLSHAFEKGSDAALAGTPHMRAGTRLVRQWGDRVHLVNVESPRVRVPRRPLPKSL